MTDQDSTTRTPPGSRRPRQAPSPASEDLLREAIPVAQARAANAEAPAPEPEVRRTGPAQGIPPYAEYLLAEAVAVEPPPDELLDDSPFADKLAKRNGLLTTLLNILFVLAVILALFAVSQAVLMFNQIALLPPVVRPFCYTLLGILALVLVYGGMKFTWRYLRLRVSPTLDLQLERDLRRLDDARREMREHNARHARQILTGLLEEYPLQRPRDIRHLRQTGFSRIELETLTGTRFHLTGRSAPADDTRWLQVYQEDFLSILDTVADRQVRQYYTRVLGLTAASPRGGLDTLIVLWCSYEMVFDLCTIYNVRSGRWGTALILAHLLVNVLAARGVHDAADSAAGSLNSVAHQHLTQTAATAAGVAARLLGKVAEGGVNCLLMYRLSMLARDYLRPIRRRPQPASQESDTPAESTPSVAAV